MEGLTSNDISLSTPKVSIWKLVVIQGPATIALSYIFLSRGFGILEIALLGSILVGLPILFQPKLGLILCIALNITSASAAFLGGLYLSVAAVTIAAWILRKLATEPTFVRAPQNQLIYAFTAIAIFSLAFSTNLDRGFESLMVYLKVIALYILIVNIIDTPRFLKAILWVIILSALSVSLFGMYQFVSTPLFAGGLNRIASTREDPNNLALTLVSVIPLAIALLKIEKKNTTKAILALASLTMFFAILLTLSRGGFLALGVILFLLIAQTRRKTVAVLLLLSIIGPSLLLLPTEVWERVGTIGLTSVDRSIQMRVELLKGGLKMFLDHPLFGVGIGNFITHSVRYSGVLVPSFAHNMFLHVAAETGVLGVLFFSSLIWITWRVLRRVQKLAFRERDSVFYQISQGLEISLIGFCVASLFLSQHFNKMLWIIMALTTSINHIYTTARKSYLHLNSSSLS